MTKRTKLIGLVLVADARHGLKTADFDVLGGFVTSGRPVLVLATKADKLNQSERRKAVAGIATQLRDAFADRAESVRVIAFSATKGLGVEEADALLAQWLAD